jgi:hypothetical protein
MGTVEDFQMLSCRARTVVFFTFLVELGMDGNVDVYVVDGA